MVVSISTITGVARNYVEIFFRRKWLFIVPTVLVTSLAVVFSFTIPPKYRTHAIVLVEEEKISNPLITGLAVSNSIQARLGTIVKVLLSRPVLEKVIKDLNLANENMDSYSFDNLIESIRDSISVQLLGTDILKVSCEYDDPVTCQKIVNSVTTLFIKHNLELQMSETNAGIEFLEHQRKIYEEKLKVSEKALRKFKENFQTMLSTKTSKQVSELIGSSAPMVNVNVLRYTEYKGDLISLNLQLKEAEKRKEQLTKQLNEEQEYVVSERLIDPGLGRLKAALTEKQVELAKLEADATEAHPMVIRLRGEIKELKETITKRRSQVYSSSDKESLNPLYQDIKMELKKLDATIESLKTKINLTELYIEDYAKRVEQIPEKEAEMVSLQRDYAINSSIYADLTQRLETAFLTQRLELYEKGTKFRVVDPARVPLKPFKPNRQFMGIAGMVFGMVIGIGLIFMAEMTDHSFTEINQLRNFLNVPVLGSISQILTLDESEEIKAHRKLGVLFLIVFAFFSIIGAIVRYMLVK